jgi:hypothetical protein
VDGTRLREQPNDSFEDLLEVERRPDRRDDLLEETLVDSCRRLSRDDPPILLPGPWEWKP